jgi:hypothetical protein
MGLFGRSPDVRVTVTPDAVRRRQTVTVTITADAPIDKVSTATLQWGYTNFYRYRWAGRADSTAVEMNDVWWMLGEVGTDAGSEKDTEDWVGVTTVDLPVRDGQFSGGTSSFTVPSWAPGSSDVLARWSARLTVERGGRDIDTRGDFRVLIGAHDVAADEQPQRRIGGDGATEMDILLDSPVVPAGATINGTVRLTPTVDMSDGELNIHWAYSVISHPLKRRPASGGGSKSGPTIKLGKGIPLRKGAPVAIPFAVPLPADSPPTGEAVHSSLVWFVEATMMYAKWTQGIEKVRRRFAVVNAP